LRIRLQGFPSLPGNKRKQGFHYFGDTTVCLKIGPELSR